MYMIASNNGDWESNMIGQVAFINDIADFDCWYEGLMGHSIVTKREVTTDEDYDILMDEKELSYYCDVPDIIYVVNEGEAVIPDIYFISKVVCEVGAV